MLLATLVSLLAVHRRLGKTLTLPGGPEVVTRSRIRPPKERPPVDSGDAVDAADGDGEGLGKGKGKGKGIGQEADMDSSPQLGQEWDMRSKDMLVRKLKRRQRSDTTLSVEWHKYCDDYGGGMRDPSRQNPDFIQHFLSSYEEAAKSPAAQEESNQRAKLVERFRGLQNEDLLVRWSWHRHCEDRGYSRVRDPTAHTAEFLRGFLKDYDEGLLQEVRLASDELVARWTDRRAEDPQFKLQWRMRCEEYGYQVHGGYFNPRFTEPMGQPADFIEDFLEDWDAGRLFHAEPATEGMCQRIEELVTLEIPKLENTKNWKGLGDSEIGEAWLQYTTKGGFKVSNPRAHSASFVQEFLEKWDTSDE